MKRFALISCTLLLIVILQTEAEKDYCPVPRPTRCGECKDNCFSDEECPRNQLCCKENCGNACRDPSSCPTSGKRATKPSCKGETFCPLHEKFVACKGHCEKDCSNRNNTSPPCSGFCVSECKCECGYVRGPKGTCIKPKKCPHKDPTHYPVKRVCPENERWDAGSAHCQTNCTNIGKPLPCPKIAVAGCVCQEGLYRGPDGKCIPEDQCPKQGDSTEQCSEFCPVKKNIQCFQCQDTCFKDGDCSRNQVCCRENCGNTCRDAVCYPTTGVPAIGPSCPQFCPEMESKDCVRCEDKCLSDDNCNEGEVCCQENCGNICLEASPYQTTGEPANGPSC